MKSVVLALSLFLIGCSASSNSFTKGPAAVDVAEHTGTYISASNSWSQPAVLQIDAGGRVMGNTYATLADAQAAVDAGYAVNTGKFTGTFVGTMSYTDPSESTHTNKMHVVLQYQKAGADFGPALVSTAHFDGAGNVIQKTTDTSAFAGTWSKPWHSLKPPACTSGAC